MQPPPPGLFSYRKVKQPNKQELGNEANKLGQLAKRLRPHKINYLILIRPTYQSHAAGGILNFIFDLFSQKLPLTQYVISRTEGLYKPTRTVGVTLPRNNNYSDCQNSVRAGMRIILCGLI